MKKLILTVVTVLSLAACKKQGSESESANPGEMMTGDSISTSAPLSSEIQGLKDGPKMDSTIAVKDTATVKIQELKEEKQILTEKVAKTMDSTTRSAIVSEIKITQKKIDSVRSYIAVSPKIKKVAPSVIRETKVIYRETPTPKVITRTPKTAKKGELELLVEDLDAAQIITKEQIAKYDGTIKNEQISTYDKKEYSYLSITLPYDKSDYFIEDLEDNVGTVISRNIEITGSDFDKNALCQLEITLVNNSKNASAMASTTSFGGKTLGAVGSGWNVIQEIFLFILPFWPMFLLGGGIYYFIKKKKREEASS